MTLQSLCFTCLLALSCTLPARAQHHPHMPPHGDASHAGAAPAATPYAGMQQRSIKALSPQQMQDLQAGKGMGLAMPAELNGYPGPLHVLELAEALQLSADQRARTQAAYDTMLQQARQAGAQVIAAEHTLDALFAQQQATPENVAQAAQAAATAHARLRAIHLHAHLVMRDVLSPDQVAQYQRLRGYGEVRPAQP